MNLRNKSSAASSSNRSRFGLKKDTEIFPASTTSTSKQTPSSLKKDTEILPASTTSTSKQTPSLKKDTEILPASTSKQTPSSTHDENDEDTENDEDMMTADHIIRAGKTLPPASTECIENELKDRLLPKRVPFIYMDFDHYCCQYIEDIEYLLTEVENRYNNVIAPTIDFLNDGGKVLIELITRSYFFQEHFAIDKGRNLDVLSRFLQHCVQCLYIMHLNIRNVFQYTYHGHVDNFIIPIPPKNPRNIIVIDFKKKYPDEYADISVGAVVHLNLDSTLGCQAMCTGMKKVLNIAKTKVIPHFEDQKIRTEKVSKNQLIN